MTYPNATHVSPHLRWVELRCQDAARTPYPQAWRESRAVPLAKEFEAIRTIIGAPIQIGSGYRTAEHNRAIGGSRHSQHVEGRALDLYPPTGWVMRQFADVIHVLAIAPASAIHGLGRYPAFIHIDIRPGPRLICWQGSRAWAEVKRGDHAPPST